ncbi:hypothetical protein ACR79N_16135 [Sphingobacterium siyangense]|uniref:hypothetical protein n=1 Tax=Sphingobacterium siyangense TaxID=459529 RepID=UPI003DA3009F
MILTGQAKRAFIDHHWQSKFKEEDYKEYENYLDKAELNHLYSDIIEWLDSVGIYLTIGRYGYILNTDDRSISRKTGETRKEATEAAIIKANEIYNETR